MSLHILLKDYNNQSQIYDIPCADGELSEINAIQAGTITDHYEKVWTVTRNDSGNAHQIIIQSPNSGVSYDLDRLTGIIMPMMGIRINNAEHNLVDFIPAAFTSDTYLIPLDRTQQTPALLMSKNGPTTSGRQHNKYSGYFYLKGTSHDYSLNWTSYDFYNSAGTQLQAYQRTYATLLGLKTTSGLNDMIFGTIAILQTDNLTFYGYTIQIDFHYDVNANNWGTPDLDPGDEGFKPTNAHTKKGHPGIGGRGTANKQEPEYKSDAVTNPGAPDETQASAVRSGFLNVYKMSESQLNNVCQCLYSQTLMDAINSLFVNPLDFIVSLMIFPCSPSVSGSENIKLGKWLCAATGAAGQILGTNMTGDKLSTQYKEVPMGSVQIPENWGNFLDYSHTSIELYLPFIGSVDIDPSECMGGTITVDYTIDFFTGQCVANVLCERPVTLPNGKIFGSTPAQHSYQGNCAVQIPLSAQSYGSMVGNLINACTNIMRNPIAGLVTTTTDMVNGAFRPNISTKGSIVANSGFCSVLYPYVRLTRPITAEPESYQEAMGYPSYINTSIGECTGLCVCEAIDLKGITGATENELTRIEQLCKEGIYN